MHRKLVRGRFFIKDHAKVKWTDQHYTKFIIYIGKLLAKEILPPEALDHQLKGEWADFREFHVSGDLLVVYRIDEDIIYLTRIGTHTQIFG